MTEIIYAVLSLIVVAWTVALARYVAARVDLYPGPRGRFPGQDAPSPHEQGRIVRAATTPPPPPGYTQRQMDALNSPGRRSGHGSRRLR